MTAHAAPNAASAVPIDFRELEADVLVLKVESGREHVRLTQGSRSISLEVEAGTILRGAVYLRFRVDDLGTVPNQIVTMDRLFALHRLRQFRKKDFPPDKRRSRWLLALKALDLEQAGFSQRQIADQLVEQELGLKWRDQGSRLRSRIRRVITLGRCLRDGGYLQLLSGGEPIELRDLH